MILVVTVPKKGSSRSAKKQRVPVTEEERTGAPVGQLLIGADRCVWAPTFVPGGEGFLLLDTHERENSRGEGRVSPRSLHTRLLTWLHGSCARLFLLAPGVCSWQALALAECH